MTCVKPGSLLYWHSDGLEVELPLDHEITTLGRSPTCAVVIPAPTVSRLHARIERQYDRYMLFDADSANGTFLNGARIEQGRQLAAGDEIWLGSIEVALRFSSSAVLDAPPDRRLAALYIDERAGTVHVYDVLVPLDPQAYCLLLYLSNHPGTVCTRAACILAVWGHRYDAGEEMLDACAGRLRDSLHDAARAAGQSPPSIVPMSRVGLCLDSPVAFAPYP